MVNLIAQVRDLIADQAGASQVFSNQAVQDALDRHRDDVRYLELTCSETIAPGGAVSYHEYFAELGDWEDGVLLQGNAWQTLAPGTSNLLLGQWSFNLDTQPPIYASGRSYDVYRSAVSLLRTWQAREPGRDGLSQLINLYSSQVRARSISLIRSDCNI